MPENTDFSKMNTAYDLANFSKLIAILTMVMKYKILRQCRNKLENGLKPLGVLIGAAEGSVRGSHD